MRLLILPVLSCAALLVACPITPASPGGGGDDGGGVEVLDGSLGDGGAPRDGGGGGGTDGGGGGTDGGCFRIGDGGCLDFGDGGGFSLDGGIVEYVGEPEEGVRCGDPLATCVAGAACCLNVDFATFSLTGTCSDTTDGACAMGNPVACDGPEECTGVEQVCCLHLALQGANAVCNTAAQCAADQNSQVCVTSDDCPAPQHCCGVTFPIPVDLGQCQDQC